jgi:hypothetical protein
MLLTLTRSLRRYTSNKQGRGDGMRVPITKCRETATCSSTEIEAVTIQPPVRGADALRHDCDGYCPVCFWLQIAKFFEDKLVASAAAEGPADIFDADVGKFLM